MKLTTIETRCSICEGTEAIPVPADGYAAWRGGTLAQVALADVHAIQREQLITGYCGPCWEDLFAEEPEDDPPGLCPRCETVCYGDCTAC